MTVKQLDSYALEWIKLRSLTLAKSINKTTLEALKELVANLEADMTLVEASREIEKWFSANEKWKAEMVSRTETIAVNNEAVLHRFELEGVDKSEWYASPSACDECAAENGNVYLTKEAHDRIPKHPNCKCMFLGVVE